MAQPPKENGGRQLNFLLPIKGGVKQTGLSVSNVSDTLKESRRRLMKDLEKTGLRKPAKK